MRDQTGIFRTDWTPSETQLRVLSHFQAADYACTVVDACTACSVGRQTFYDWFARPEFARWWGEQGERWAALQVGRVYSALVRSAAGQDVGGNPTDRKTFLERFDERYAPRQRNELSGEPPAISINITKTYAGPAPADFADDERARASGEPTGREP